VMDADKFIRADRTKRAILIAFGASVFILLLASGLRFVPRFEDALSGRPEYLHAIADRMARSLTDSTNHELLVLVRKQQEYDCDRTQNVPSRDTTISTTFLYTPRKRSHCASLRANVSGIAKSPQS
jgi:hypothetical protein